MTSERIPASDRRPVGSETRRSRASVPLLLAACLAVAGCSDPVRDLLALSDEIAGSCADLAGRMADGWEQTETVRQRAVSYAEADLGHLDVGRARCKGALRLINELDRSRRPLDPAAEEDLQAVLTLDRLLLESIEDPSMERWVFAATREAFAESYLFTRPRLQPVMPMGPAEQQRRVGRLLPRWNAATQGAAR